MSNAALGRALRRASWGLLGPARPNGLPAYAQSVLVVGLCAALAWQLSPHLRSGNLLMIFLLGTVVVSTRLGRGPSVVAALLSVTAFDLLFVPPRFNFALADVEYLLTSAVLLAVALVISSRSARLREHAAAVREYERKTAAVREAARAVQVAQLQGLTAAALAVGSRLSVEEALQILVERARGVIGAHLSIARLALDGDGPHALVAVSASDDYAAWRDSPVVPREISRRVCQSGRPLRMTQAQFEADPACTNPRGTTGARLPLRGWLAVPLSGPDGRPLGVIQLSDKSGGEFTEADEAILVQLAQIGSVAVEKARLYEDAERRRKAAEQLYAMSYELATTPDVSSLLMAGLRHIGEVFGSRVVVLLPEGGGDLAPRLRYPAGEIEPGDPAVSRWVYEHRKMAGAGTDVFSASPTLHLPLVGSRETIGVLEVAPRRVEALVAPGQLLLLETFANQIALAVERATLAEQAHQAYLRMETERLRSALLSSISHDLRTPLAAITGAASSLLWRDEQFDPETRRELKETIHEEAERLARLVENLLDMTRLESGVRARKEWQPLEEVVGAALARLERRLRGRPVTTSLPRDLPLVPIDDVLIEQVLINLVDNAIKYTAADTPLEISAASGDGIVAVAVGDRGPGLEPGDQERVFEKFYRGSAQHVRGAGLGLAICHGIIQAHGGRIWAENRPGGGALFRFTLPLGPVPSDVEARDA